MLSELRVKSFGIIDELAWNPVPGLAVITGETGAGKSLVIDAISALVDGRLEEGAIRSGAGAARLEGVFCLPFDRLPALNQLLEDKGVPLDEGSLIMSCELRRQGRAVLRLNGSAVPRALLREVGHALVDIHSQSEHLSLFDRQNHLDYLDIYGHTIAARDKFADLAAQLARARTALADMERARQDRAHREEILGYQTEEIRRAKIQPGEEEELALQRQKLASTEKLKALAYEATQALDGEEGAALSRIHQAREALRRLAAIDPSLDTSLSLIDEAYVNIQELSRDMRGYEEELEFEPRRLEEIDDRLEILRGLKKKYGGSLEAVQCYLEDAEKELAELADYDESRASMESRIEDLKCRLGDVASELSEARRAAAERLAAAVQKELADLGLGQVTFEVKLERKPDPDGLPLAEGPYAFNRWGVDEVEFLVSTNPGEPMKPLADIASTGEVSRFTLALKVALAEADRTPLLIFDEIDIGVGGRSGEVVGQKLWRLARHHQVICISHLPQIAAYGDAHFSVRKETRGERTVSLLAEVNGEARVNELAAMIGSGQPAYETAVELVGRARRWAAEQKT